MALLTICLVIIPIKFINVKQKNSHLTLNRKQRLWRRLPYPLRLRIEHLTFVANEVKKHSDCITMNRISRYFYLKLAPLYEEIIKLNNPYKPFINAPISDERALQSINNFLKRFQ